MYCKAGNSGSGKSLLSKINAGFRKRRFLWQQQVTYVTPSLQNWIQVTWQQGISGAVP